MDNSTKQEILQAGIASDFWKLICEALQDSIEKLRQDQKSQELKSLPAEEYKLVNELCLARLEYLENLTELPDNLIVFLNSVSESTENFDPYAVPGDFEK